MSMSVTRATWQRTWPRFGNSPDEVVSDGTLSESISHERGVMNSDRFRNREEAGRELGRALSSRFGHRDDTVVLALPRGGVPIGYEVARAIGAPLDVFIVRKLGFPGHEELAMGAIASGGVRVLNDELFRQVPVPMHTVDAVTQREMLELERRERSYRGSRPPLNIRDKTVIVVDDGLATGSTMRAAVRALRQMNPRSIVVAVPVAAKETCDEFRAEADEILCLRTPEPFQAVGLWYDEFDQTSDEEVHELLDRAATVATGAS
jgi:putative phosphoribosyl transferase